jgi:hypothetical protein
MRPFALLLGVLVLASGVGLARAEGVEPVEGGWKGKTSQGLYVYFGVRNGRVVNTRYRFRWGFCGTYGSHWKRAHLEIDPAGHWTVSDPRGSTFEGTFVAPDRVEGRVSVVERELPGCPKVEAPFVARPRRR